MGEPTRHPDVSTCRQRQCIVAPRNRAERPTTETRARRLGGEHSADQTRLKPGDPKRRKGEKMAMALSARTSEMRDGQDHERGRTKLVWKLEGRGSLNSLRPSSSPLFLSPSPWPWPSYCDYLGLACSFVPDSGSALWLLASCAPKRVMVLDGRQREQERKLGTCLGAGSAAEVGCQMV